MIGRRGKLMRTIVRLSDNISVKIIGTSEEIFSFTKKKNLSNQKIEPAFISPEEEEYESKRYNKQSALQSGAGNGKVKE